MEKLRWLMDVFARETNRSPRTCETNLVILYNVFVFVFNLYNILQFSNSRRESVSVKLCNRSRQQCSRNDMSRSSRLDMSVCTINDECTAAGLKN